MLLVKTEELISAYNSDTYNCECHVIRKCKECEERKERLLLVEQAQKEMFDVKELLEEAMLQIEYLHNKFQPTGTGNAVLAKISALKKQT